MSTPSRLRRKLTVGQLKTWEDIEPLSGNARWTEDWAKSSNELAQDRRTWSASIPLVALIQPARANAVTSISLYDFYVPSNHGPANKQNSYTVK